MSEKINCQQGVVTPADMVRTYLQEIGKIDRLTPEQEIELGKQVQQMMQLLEVQDKIAAETGQTPDVELWAEQAGTTVATLQDALRQGKQAKKRMILANLRLVVSIAKKYQKRNLELLDLIQEGNLGLERAVEKFDPSRGCKFSTYAYWWICQSLTRAIAQQGRIIRLPVHITETLNKIKKTQRSLSQQLGQAATSSEIAQALECEPVRIREYLLMSRSPISLNSRIGDNEDTELEELLEDQGISPEEFTIQECLREDLERLMAELPPQEREVIYLRFGWHDGKELSLSKVGEQLNLSRERVRQLEQRALTYLRRHRGKIQDYLAS
jgi:RNA polymerase nonessential primary-like sigma factor